MIAFHRVKKSPLITGIVDRIKINSESELPHTFCKLHVSTYFTSVSFISRIAQIWINLYWQHVCIQRLPRTQTSLSLDENVLAKEGGKRQWARLLPSVPFPWSLAVHHQSLACTLRKTNHLRRRLIQRCCERGPKSQLAKEMSGRGRRSREKRETKESEILVSQIFYNFFLFIFFFSCFTL